jgi:hypothetical protein
MKHFLYLRDLLVVGRAPAVEDVAPKCQGSIRLQSRLAVHN